MAFAAIGLAGVTALEAMRRLGPCDGKTLLVSGATGGVGAVAGYSTEDLDGDALRTATRELLGLRLPPPPTKVLSLAEAARAHALLEGRAVRGRVVLVP